MNSYPEASAITAELQVSPQLTSIRANTEWEGCKMHISIGSDLNERIKGYLALPEDGRVDPIIVVSRVCLALACDFSQLILYFLLTVHAREHTRTSRTAIQLQIP